MELKRGHLVVTKKGKGKSPRIQVRVGEKPAFNPVQGEISQSLLDRLDEFHEKEVEFELVRGQPTKVREVGGTFTPPRAMSGGADRGSRGGSARGGQHSPRRQGGRDQYVRRLQADFHNPYNFVPSPPRETDDSDLCDHRPARQDTFDAKLYTGRIRVRMVAETPLLLPETEQVPEGPGHKTYPLRTGADRKPLIPASSIRGMIRSAYEIVTNSRFGRFSEKQHSDRLAFRGVLRNAWGKKSFPKLQYEASAWDLLPKSLRPPATIDQLSPADRVFGWVHVDADDARKGRHTLSAVRGLLRVGPVACESSVEEAVESFAHPGVPLAILSTPKPQQGRFYVAKSVHGEAQRDGLSKEDAGYSRDKGLRGRKVYPHQRGLPGTHWDDPTMDRTTEGSGTPFHYQEYRRPQNEGQERDDQNRSILGWVKPGAKFTFDLHVHNLSTVELGALLWLLTLPQDHFFRFGGGKPLGFGSVRLQLAACDARTGKELCAHYKAWQGQASGADPRDEAIRAFKEALCRAYPPNAQSGGSGGFDDISFIQAFLVACRGFSDGLPIHYPRATVEDGRPGPPHPEGESFKWFVANEKDGARYVLQDLRDDKGLPTLGTSRR